MRSVCTALLGFWVIATAQLNTGCGPTTVIELSPPLTVVDTFPANGARLPGATVTHIDVVFSDAVDGKQALDAIRLESVDDSDEVEARYTLAANSELGEDGFDAERLTLSAQIGDPSADGELPDGQVFRLTIAKGLEAEGGSVLPVDVIHRFATGQ